MEAGDEAEANRLLPLVYDELKALARQYMRRERPDHTLHATALVHEAYVRLVDQSRVDWKGRTHFIGVASQMIRRVLVDHARKHGAAKRGKGAAKLALDAVVLHDDAGPVPDLVELDEALSQLARLDQRQGRVVELRYFGGLGVKETALVLDVSERTVKNDGRVAKAWLRERIGR